MLPTSSSFFQIMMLILSTISAIRLNRVRSYNFLRKMSETVNADVSTPQWNGDELITGLNGNQDISIKVVSCRELVQEAIMKKTYSSQSARALGEVMVCSLMMGAGLKGEETLQVNMVGLKGMKNVMAITDGNLATRGMVGNPEFSTDSSTDEFKISDCLGLGQLQIVRNHPVWKQPMNGITELRDSDVALNLALYMAESEQRMAAMITDVKVEGGLCRYALGVMVERLPGCVDENVEKSITNLEAVGKKGLRSYLDRSNWSAEEKLAESIEGSEFRGFSTSLNKILDDCLAGMETEENNSIRWSKSPSFRCSCGIEKVWNALQIMPTEDIKNVIAADENVEMTCGFCNKVYSLSSNQISDKFFPKV